MPRKGKPPTDRAAEQADYAAWKITAGTDLLERHDVKPGIIPERLWRGRRLTEAHDNADGHRAIHDSIGRPAR
jgi:hypothetical protein